MSSPIMYVFAGNHAEYVQFCKSYDIPQTIVKYIHRKEQLKGLQVDKKKLHITGTAQYHPHRHEILNAARDAGFEV